MDDYVYLTAAERLLTDDCTKGASLPYMLETLLEGEDTLERLIEFYVANVTLREAANKIINTQAAKRKSESKRGRPRKRGG